MARVPPLVIAIYINTGLNAWHSLPPHDSIYRKPIKTILPTKTRKGKSRTLTYAEPIWLRP